MAQEGYYRAGGLPHRLVVDEEGERLVLPYRRRPISWVDWLFGTAALAVVTVLTLRALRGPVDLLSADGIGWLTTIVSLLVAAAGRYFGRETIRVRGGRLEISRGIGPLRRTWRFPAAAIRGLTTLELPDNFLVDRWKAVQERWPWARPRDGAVKFDCGDHSVYLAEAADPPEGRAIAEWLARRLPPSATEWGA